MSPWLWIVIPLGIGLILFTVFDVILTVLHTQAESPLSTWLNRGLWRGMLGIGRWLPGGARDELLGWGLPLMVGGVIALWAALYIVGFGLLYLPMIHDPAMFAAKDAIPSWSMGDAFYFSAVTFLTIGYGDITASHPLPRLLTVLEGGSGLITISLSATYLLSVYPLISRKAAVAASLSHEAGGRTDGVVVAQRYVVGGRVDALGGRLRWLNDELLSLGQAHDFYPVLYYVRPTHVQGSFARILAVVQGVVGTLRYGLDPIAHRDVVTDPRLLLLEEGLLYTLHSLADSSHLVPEGEADDDNGNARADYAELLFELTRHGLSVAPIDGASAEAYVQFRAATDHYIRAYAENIGYEPDVICRTFGRRERNTALDVEPGTDLTTLERSPS